VRASLVSDAPPLANRKMIIDTQRDRQTCIISTQEDMEVRASGDAARRERSGNHVHSAAY
jgi:hypothetical protein